MASNWPVVILMLVVVSQVKLQDVNNHIGLDRPTDKPVEITDDEIDILVNNFLSGTSSTATPAVDPGAGRVPEEGGQGPTDCECVLYYQCRTNGTINEDGEGIIDIRMKDGPCESYMEVCCKLPEVISILDNTTPTTPVDPVTSKPVTTCGRRNPEGVSMLRIVGGDDEAQFGEFPWMVAVMIRQELSPEQSVNVYQCGGSLIHPRVVLTGAHCVQGKDALTVRVGEWDTQHKNEPLPSQDRQVTEVVIHQSFNNGSLSNDVALLFLDSPVNLAANVAPICLPEQGEIMDNRNCVASGWGKDRFGKEGQYQVILKKLELPVVPRAPCLDALRKTRLGARFNLHDSFICAGGLVGKDTCRGDGGSPLVCPTRDNPNVYVQAGIVAWGIGCGSEVPGVYAGVANFRTWIDRQLGLKNIIIGMDSELPKY